MMNISPKSAAGSTAKSKKRLGVAALVVAAVFAVFFVLQNTDKKHQKQTAITAATQPMVMATSSAAVQDYQKSLDQTASMAQARTAGQNPAAIQSGTFPSALPAQKPSAYPLPPGPSSVAQGTIPPTAYSQPGYVPQAISEPAPRAGSSIYGTGTAESGVQQEREELRREREKQLFNARFASSVALSRRTTSAALIPTSGNAQQLPAVMATPAAVTPPAVPAASTAQTATTTTKPKHPEREPGTMLLPEGTTLDTVLQTRLNGTFAGPAKVMVTQDIYDRSRELVLIPAGSILLGEVRPVQKLGEERLAVTFHRLLRSDGYTADLDTFTGLDQIGETALKDKVNHHYIQVFGVSVALGAIAGLSQINSNAGFNESGSDLYRQGFSSSLDSSAQRILDKYTNILPTVVIREGTRVKVYLTNDLYLPPSLKHPIMD
jgi:type IV secretory pathway VirB10-like protein